MNRRTSLIIGLLLVIVAAVIVLAADSTLVRGLGIALAVLGIGWMAISARR